jgi:hypothetical protein
MILTELRPRWRTRERQRLAGLSDRYLAMEVGDLQHAKPDRGLDSPGSEFN